MSKEVKNEMNDNFWFILLHNWYKVIESSTSDIDISTLASGLYYIITNKGRSQNLKFIKD